MECPFVALQVGQRGAHAPVDTAERNWALGISPIGKRGRCAIEEASSVSLGHCAGHADHNPRDDAGSAELLDLALEVAAWELARASTMWADGHFANVNPSFPPKTGNW